MTTLGDVQARSLDRPAIRVACDGSAWSDRQMRALCQQMVQSLARVAPQAAFRQVTSAQWRPYGAADVSVRLEMTQDTGKLLWQVGPDGPLHSGPDQPFPARGFAGAADLRRFTDALVTSTPPMRAALRTTTPHLEK